MTSETEREGARESVVHEVHNLQGRTNQTASSSPLDGESDLKLGGGPEVGSSWAGQYFECILLGFTVLTEEVNMVKSYFGENRH